MKIFCFDCNRLVCRDCILYDHRQHKSDFLKKCASERRKTLSDSLAPLLKVRAEVAAAEKALLAEKTLVSAQNAEVCKSLQSSFDKLRAILDQRKSELVRQANRSAQCRQDELTAQKKELEVAHTEIQSLVEFVERNLENTSDQDLMRICEQLQTKIEEGEKHHWKMSLKQVTTADIVCSPPSLDAVPRDLGAVFALPKLCSVGEPTQFSVKVPKSMGTNIQVQLKSVVYPHCIVSASVVTARNDNTYLITYTPQVRGPHDLAVKVNGKDIFGSPYRVFVKIHPTQLGPPVRMFEGFSDPWGIAINNKQQLVVAEGNGKKITIMERDGKRVQTIECDKFQYPHGVASGSDDAVYVTDTDAHCLFKFSKYGKLCKIVPNLSCPLFVKVIQNQIYVSDYDNNVVKIFDVDCNAVGTITTSECPKPVDIAEKYGNLYVGSDGKKSIGVYQCKPGGKCMYHLTIKGFGCLCFDKSGYLYVAVHEFGLKGVYVLDPDGKFVTSFGLGKIQNPAGLVIDDDGYVYVCDWISQGKIYVF